MRHDRARVAYRQTGTEQAMERWIHVDLKTLVPTPDALMRDISEWAKRGATGVVFEWENVFPYPGFGQILRQDAYSPEEVTRVLDHCRSLGLKAIPLVQTFGHVEWCLAHEAHASLREFEDTPGQIRACDEQAWAVLNAWLGAVIEAHHDSPYVHLGADEAWRLHEVDRPDCSAKREGAAAVFLRHMQPLIEQVLAAGKRPIIWADMVLKHPEAIGDFPRELIFCDWLYSQTSEYASGVHGWGLGRVDAESYGELPENRKALFEKYWRMDAEDFPAQFYQFPYLPFLRDRGFDVVACPATLYARDGIAGPQLVPSRANARGWLQAAHRFGGLGALNTCWAVRGALRERARTGHRAFLLLGQDPASMPDDAAVSEMCWRHIAGDRAAEVAAVVDRLAPPGDLFSRTSARTFDPQTRSHASKPYNERLSEAGNTLAELPDDAPETLERLDVRDRAAAAEKTLGPLAQSSDEAQAWLLAAGEAAIRADLWLAARGKVRGVPPSVNLAELGERVRRQADRVEAFMTGRYQPEEVKIVRDDRYAGVLWVIKQLAD